MPFNYLCIYSDCPRGAAQPRWLFSQRMAGKWLERLMMKELFHLEQAAQLEKPALDSLSDGLAADIKWAPNVSCSLTENCLCYPLWMHAQDK